MKTWMQPWAARRASRREAPPEAPAEILLAPREILRANGLHGGLRVQCREGRVWITQAGDQRDHLLQRGEESLTEGRGLVLVEALGPAIVRISVSGSTPSSQG